MHWAFGVERHNPYGAYSSQESQWQCLFFIFLFPVFLSARVNHQLPRAWLIGIHNTLYGHRGSEATERVKVLAEVRVCHLPRHLNQVTGINYQIAPFFSPADHHVTKRNREFQSYARITKNRSHNHKTHTFMRGPHLAHTSICRTCDVALHMGS
ncbi:hypothetical protein F5Y01DRAFT_240039 [Xylaria sp. FL0043]|nr:hypothetical protein F5Y01DRAFT_240039 [Xylaria sp. FL0043]